MKLADVMYSSELSWRVCTVVPGSDVHHPLMWQHKILDF